MKLFRLTPLLFLLMSNCTSGQTINTSVPKKIDKSSRYVFYLHGKIVEEKGVHAVSPHFGAYKYLDILDTLKRYGFNVISEARPKHTDENIYADKVSKQIDTLLNAGVPVENIFVLDASKDAYITLLISEKVKNNKINYAVMGVCSREDDPDGFPAHKINLCGNFLSIYETSDSYGGSCEKLLSNQECVTGFQEIQLNMDNQHGFLYKPYSEWVDPFIKWVNKK